MPNPTRWLFNFTLGLLILGITAVLSADDPMPDFGAMDRDVLVMLAQRQHQRIEQLELENAELREAIKATGALHDDGVTLIPDGVWIVTVESVGSPDTTALEAELAGLHKQSNSSKTGQPAGAYGPTPDPYGSTSTRTGTYGPGGTSDRAERQRQAEIERARQEREKRGLQSRIQSLEQRLQDAANTAIVTGKTDGGLPVTITARGVRAGDGLTMVAGQTYTVTGRGAFTEFDGKIDLKTADEYLE